ncbi:Hypp8069 [Branchiostoma lanceolatum]|uniref:Hypp8069 protein n=1 Tax=Branchiostoma lanceolatum TaxID=7740 RepID=A0A8K0EDR8_BRALA|nr:Hypp8069 [Branchiostoma lanceolatum]
MADFSGKWRPVEGQQNEESFIKFFAAMGSPNPTMAQKLFKTAENYEIIDKGDTVIFRIPDSQSDVGTKDILFKVGQENEVVGPIGVPVKKFVTKEGNKLTFHETAPNGEKNVTVRELQGDRMMFSKTHEGSGVTASAVFTRQ